MARILIDGRFVGVGESMTRYVLEFFSRLLALDSDNEYTLLVRPIGIKSVADYFPVEQISNSLKINNYKLKIEVLDIPHYSISEQTKLLQYLNKEKFDLVHFIQFNHPVFYRGKFVTSIHDLTMIGHLHYFNFIKQLAFNAVMRDAAKRSKKVITISKTSRDDIISHYHLPADRIAVTYLSVDHERYNSRIRNNELGIRQFKAKHKIAGDYILYTGMWKKHKNLKRLFQAFEKFLEAQVASSKEKGKQIQLVLTGKIDSNEPQVIAEIDRINKRLSSKYPHSIEATRGKQVASSKTNNLATRSSLLVPIVTTGFIQEDELPTAYAGALAYVIPSLSEGFGLPPLEAMACGTPVISSNVSCMPEILGQAPLYFDPYNIEDIEKAIEKVTGDDKLRAELSKKGLEQAKKYDWKRTAEQTLEVYKEVLGTNIIKR